MNQNFKFKMYLSNVLPEKINSVLATYHYYENYNNTQTYKIDYFVDKINNVYGKFKPIYLTINGDKYIAYELITKMRQPIKITKK